MRSSRRKARMSRGHGAGSPSPLPLLLDSTYLLPVFGVEVEGVSASDLLKLRSLALTGRIELYYSPFSLIEVVSKVAREAQRSKVRLSREDIKSIVDLIEGASYLRPVYPDSRAYALAYEMKMLGHRDMIDCILYATATVHGFTFLTMDSELKEFVGRHGLRGSEIIDHRGVLARLGSV